MGDNQLNFTKCCTKMKKTVGLRVGVTYDPKLPLDLNFYIQLMGLQCAFLDTNRRKFPPILKDTYSDHTNSMISRHSTCPTTESSGSLLSQRVRRSQSFSFWFRRRAHW